MKHYIYIVKHYIVQVSAYWPIGQLILEPISVSPIIFSRSAAYVAYLLVKFCVELPTCM